MPAETTAAPLLAARGLTLTYPDGTQALRGLDFTLRPGEIVAVIGRSGAGKSTLLRCLNALLRPSGGVVELHGQDLNRSAASRRAAARQVAMIFQHFGLVPRVSALGNVLLGRCGQMPLWRGLLGIYSEQERQLALRALARTEILPQWKKRGSELSGGQQQRVAIARALCQQPLVLLADEPVSSLDPATARSVLEYCVSLCREDNIALVMNLHSVSLARAYAQRVVAMKDGLILFDGPAAGCTDELLKTVYGEEYADM
ncbi:phosphonate ABC transporter ATP-binding protein [bacterium]|nr:phosphonate ABC transporter ATP-binding protein [bacterium]